MAEPKLPSPERIRADAVRVLHEIVNDPGEKPTDRRQAAGDLLKLVGEAADSGQARRAQDLTDEELLEIIFEARERRALEAAEADPLLVLAPVPRETLAERLAGLAEFSGEDDVDEDDPLWR